MNDEPFKKWEDIVEEKDKRIAELENVIEDILSRSQDIEVVASEALSEGGGDE